ncbi:hypothetical protein [Companilactobacillus sp. FL22-1]
MDVNELTVNPAVCRGYFAGNGLETVIRIMESRRKYYNQLQKDTAQV